MRIAVGVALAISALQLNAPHIEPSYHLATLAHVFGSICIAALSLFPIASGIWALEATGVAAAGGQKQGEPEGKHSKSKLQHNKCCLSFTGLTMEENLGDGWAEALYNEDRERFLQTAVLIPVYPGTADKPGIRLVPQDARRCATLGPRSPSRAGDTETPTC